MVAHLSGEGARVGQKGAARHLRTHPRELAALMAHMMKSTDLLPGIADSAVSPGVARLVAQLLGVVDGELAGELAEQSKRLDLQRHA